MRSPNICLAVLALLACGAMLAAAAKPPAGKMSRALEIKELPANNPKMVTVRAMRKTTSNTGDTSSDAHMFRISVVGFPRIRYLKLSRAIDVDPNVENATNAVSKTMTSIKVGFLRVIEYYKNVSNTCWDASDQIVRSFSLIGQTTWVFADESTTDVKRFCWNLTGTSAFSGTTFKICATISGTPDSSFRMVKVGPNYIKVDVDVANFPYSNGATSVGVVALVRARSVNKDAEGGMTSTAGDLPFFTWSTNVTLPDNSTCPVTSSPLIAATDSTTGSAPPASDDDDDADETSHRIVFCLGCTQPATFSWDPELGATDSAGAAARAAAWAVLVLAALVCAAVSRSTF